MPQRRSFAPLPQNEAHVNAHGQHMTPPNLAPAPQPYAPTPAAPPPPQSMPGAVSPVAAPGAQGTPRPPLPASIPLRPMSPVAGQGQPQQPQPQPPMLSPQPRPGATISPANVDQFTSSSAQGSHSNSPDELAILKLLAQLGHTGDPNDANS